MSAFCRSDGGGGAGPAAPNLGLGGVAVDLEVRVDLVCEPDLLEVGEGD